MQYNPELYPDLGKSMRVYARDNGIFALMRGTGKLEKILVNTLFAIKVRRQQSEILFETSKAPWVVASSGSAAIRLPMFDYLRNILNENVQKNYIFSNAWV